MKSVYLTLSGILLSVFLAAQPALTDIAFSKGNANWWELNPNSNVNAQAFLEIYKQSMGFGSEVSFVLLNEEKDELGFLHSRFAQYHDGTEVAGAQLILHSSNGRVLKANGRIVAGIVSSEEPKLSFAQALQAAKTVLKAEFYNWEFPYWESLIKQLKDDENATFYPEEKLVYIEPAFSQQGDNYRLAYKLDLFYNGLNNHSTLYIDANTGKLIFEEEGCHTGSTTGTAITKYHGTQSIITDSISATKFVLNDVTRGGGVETYNMFQQKDSALAQFFEDSDNYWNNFNPQFNEVGTDVHWSTEMAYDYFLNIHNRNSYDNLGSKLISFVHYDSAYFNAFWNGKWMTYGDGSGNPLTSIDVVGHELSHGVTQNSAGLIYSYESGALNESFSDIFGTHLEFHSLPGQATWTLGLLDFIIRDMSNPNAFNQPDTYLGGLWHTQPTDNGGVHINSGVQNYWFYLLSVGGSGTNDLGNAFGVDSIGMGKAADIAYRNLSYYLTPTSQYFDARQGSLEAAYDLFGNCSNEVSQVAKAWHAVGVGKNLPAPDIEILDIQWPLNECNLGSQENVIITFKYHQSGCNDSVLAVGDSVEVSYRINNLPKVVEYFKPTSPIQNNDIVTYIFNQKADLSIPAGYLIDARVDYYKDSLRANNGINNHRVVSLVFIDQTDSLTFEGNRALHESRRFFFTNKPNSQALISFDAKNTGFYGAKLSGLNPSPNIDTAFTEADNFIVNPEYQADLCVCVDATTWNNITLSFDLKQTYSAFYQAFPGFDPATFASSIRITADGKQVGNQFHPTTTIADTFQRHFMVLDSLAGQQFQLCFQGKHFFDKQSDLGNGTIGDNSFLDNIKFDNAEFVGIPEFQEQDMLVSPNPSNGTFNVSINSYVNAALALQITDQLGRVILSRDAQVSRGENNISLNMNDAASGVYFLRAQLDNQLVVKKIIIQ